MPRIFDNIVDELPALQDTLALSHRADFCIDQIDRIISS